MMFSGFITQRLCERCLMLALGMVLAVIMSMTSLPASAAIYKCIDATGNTTYTSNPCAPDESTSRISKSASVLPVLDCRVARKFADDTAERMLAGESSGDLFNHYGGMNSTSAFVKNLVSYVYSFEGSEGVSQSRIAQLSTERCQVGSFGPVGRRCDVFPVEFIEEQGGCDKAQGLTSRVSSNDSAAGYALPALGEANPDAPRQYAAPAGSATRSTPNTSLATTRDLRTDCQQRLTRSIEQTVAQMQKAQDTKTQDRLTRRHRQLRSQMTRC